MFASSLKERLIRFFALAAVAVSAPLQVFFPPAAAWELTASQDQMTDEKFRRLIVTADPPVQISGTTFRPQLGLECDETKNGTVLDMGIAAGFFITGKNFTEIAYRIDQGDIFRRDVGVGSRGSFLMIYQNYPMLRTILSGNSLRIQPRTSSGEDPVFRFDVSDHQAVIDFVRDCIGDITVIPEGIDDEVIDNLMALPPPYIATVKEALIALKLYNLPADPIYTRELFLAAQTYARMRKTDYVWPAMVEDKTVPVAIRQKLPGYQKK